MNSSGVVKKVNKLDFVSRSNYSRQEEGVEKLDSPWGRLNCYLFGLFLFDNLSFYRSETFCLEYKF